MAFNILAEANHKLNFDEIHKDCYKANLPFEFIPMENLGVNEGDALGICIPINNANSETWNELQPVLERLRTKYSCDVFDLYGGQKLNEFNISIFKQNLLLK